MMIMKRPALPATAIPISVDVLSLLTVLIADGEDVGCAVCAGGGGGGGAVILF